LKKLVNIEWHTWRINDEKLNDRLAKRQASRVDWKIHQQLNGKQYAANRFWKIHGCATMPSIVDFQRVYGTLQERHCISIPLRVQSARLPIPIAALRQFARRSRYCARLCSCFKLDYTRPIIYKAAIGGKTVRPISEKRKLTHDTNKQNY